MTHPCDEQPELAHIVIHGTVFTLEKRDKLFIDTHFPTDSRQKGNHIYPALRTRTPEGTWFYIYLRRIIAHLMLKDEGRHIAKGFSVEVKDGDPTNLTRANLRIVFNVEREEGEIKRRNSFQTYRIVEIRIKAVSEGRDPDEVIRGDDDGEGS